MNKQFDKWLQRGIDAGWVSPVVCTTHDGLPQTDYEQDEWEEGGDPCIHGIRVWMDDIL